jgi:hypothetical protein
MTKPYHLVGPIEAEEEHVIWRMPTWQADDLANILQREFPDPKDLYQIEIEALRSAAEEARYAIRQRKGGQTE